ncbi:MAG: hypothetical protein JOZ75_14940 [Candidatus Dormibacteraeota bacterium]|nr:hypothetical protein [Candidatus Dormibacteraeota bacterium]
MLKLLSGEEPSAPYLIIACHGDEGGILLPPLGEQFEAMQPVHGILTAEALRDRVQLPDRVVIATGCGTGNPQLAQAFLEGGCAAYVAPAGAPYGSTVILAITVLFYELMRGRSLAEAMDRVKTYDEELSQWQLWQRMTSAG